MESDKNDLPLSTTKCSGIACVAMNFSNRDIIVSDSKFGTGYASAHLVK